jgi:hypothetical protein
MDTPLFELIFCLLSAGGLEKVVQSWQHRVAHVKVLHPSIPHLLRDLDPFVSAEEMVGLDLAAQGRRHHRGCTGGECSAAPSRYEHATNRVVLRRTDAVCAIDR